MLRGYNRSEIRVSHLIWLVMKMKHATKAFMSHTIIFDFQVCSTVAQMAPQVSCRNKTKQTDLRKHPPINIFVFKRRSAVVSLSWFGLLLFGYRAVCLVLHVCQNWDGGGGGTLSAAPLAAADDEEMQICCIFTGSRLIFSTSDADLCDVCLFFFLHHQWKDLLPLRPAYT